MTTTLDLQEQAEREGFALGALFALARFEGRRMVLSPVIWLGALGSVALAVLELWDLAPVLNQVSATLAWTMLPLAIAVALVAGWAVIRARGRSDADPPMVMPVSIEPRVAGILLALMWPAVMTLLLQACLLVWVWTRDPVTSLIWTEVLLGPTYVVFAGTLSATLTRWFSHPSTPLMSLLLLGGLAVAGPYDPTTWGRLIGVEWLKPMVWPESIIPYEVSFRPAALHLGYLVGLVAIAGGMGIIGRGKVGWGMIALGLSISIPLGAAQLGPISESQRDFAIAQLVGSSLNCEPSGPVTYCVMPGYAGWIDDWERALEPVLAVAPSSAIQGLEVRQYPLHNVWLLDGQEYNDWWWVEPSYLDLQRRDVVPVGSQWAVWHRAAVVSAASSWVAGCPISGDCPAEGRRVAALWLMVHDPTIRAVVSETVAAGEHTQVAGCMVEALLAKDDALSLVVENWEALVDPDTSYEQAGELLGVPVPSGNRGQGDVLAAGCD